MARILITGFTPFAGRSVNASWLAAYWLAENHNTEHTVRAALLPVVWGVPGEILQPLAESFKPDLVIAFGEGHQGRFALETRARNQRAQREDNSGSLPLQPLVSAQGVDHYLSEFNANALCQQLAKKGYPAQTSDDAGAFLCEETLYCLERIRRETSGSMKVVFCHLPPFATEVVVAGQSRVCDQALLNEFASDLLEVLTASL